MEQTTEHSMNYIQSFVIDRAQGFDNFFNRGFRKLSDSGIYDYSINGFSPAAFMAVIAAASLKWVNIGDMVCEIILSSADENQIIQECAVLLSADEQGVRSIGKHGTVLNHPSGKFPLHHCGKDAMPDWLKQYLNDGHDPDELKVRVQQKPAKQKFAQPNDASITWSGRGTKPAWMNDWIDAGNDMDDLRIRDKQAS
ncbi:H-NS histone family protein [Pseudogemmobacter bohemicus]|uniref:H-NS histone family protein n=1 Tax=Pseudogemmobacter bohemicus TaxID=2250708 RepID=UPI001300BDB6|nr:H-NS histone family protein [Pseudogemmobacter bohemicus]